MTINFLNNKIKENSPTFREMIMEEILNLKPNKSLKFKTIKGTFGVYFNKKANQYSITFNGYQIEEVETAPNAIESILGLYDAQ